MESQLLSLYIYCKKLKLDNTRRDYVLFTTRNHFQTNPRHQPDDAKRVIPSVSLNIIQCQEVEKNRSPDFLHEKLGQ